MVWYHWVLLAASIYGLRLYEPASAIGGRQMSSFEDYPRADQGDGAMHHQLSPGTRGGDRETDSAHHVGRNFGRDGYPNNR